jgi:hypothetical protein
VTSRRLVDPRAASWKGSCYELLHFLWSASRTVRSILPQVRHRAGSCAAPIPAPNSTVQRPSSALKILLMVLGGIFLLAVLIIGAAVFFVKQAVDRSAIETSEDGKGVKVQTPFGNVESSADVDKIMEKMGVPVYPSAEAVEHGASRITMNQVEVMNAMFDTEDAPEQVLAFYRGKFPDAEVIDTPENKTLMQGDKSSDHLLIAIHTSDGKTRITVTRTRKPDKEK